MSDNKHIEMNPEENKVSPEFLQLQQDVAETKQDVSEIKTALLGNKYSENRGLVYRQALTEKNLDSLTNKVNKILWTAAGISAAVSGVFGLVMIVVNVAKV